MFRYFKKRKIAQLIAAMDGNWSDVVTLLRTKNSPSANSTFLDSSVSNATVTRYGNVTQGNVSLFSGAGSSAYFDGTGDYLTVPNINFGTSGFTIEFFFKMKTLANCSLLSTSNGSYGICLQVSSGNLLIFASTNGSSWNVVNGTAIKTGIQANQAYHIAVSRLGGNLYVHLDGVVIATYALSGTLGNTAAPFAIAAHASGTMNGYIANLRVTLGTVAYTNTNFTKPTSKLAANANTVLLLDFENYGIYDAKGSVAFETAQSVAVDSVNTKNSLNSITMGATSGAMIKSRPEETLFDIYNGNFTAECNFKLSVLNPANGNTLFSIGNTTNYIQAFARNNQIVLNVKAGASNTTLTFNKTLDFNWHHFAWVRNGSQHFVYLDGVELTGGSGSLLASLSLANSPLYIGCNASLSTTFLNGNINEFRLSKIVRYNGNFTPPAVAFPVQ